jgi:4-amino-4-deoxy-L-arabinose transferase-like glycosyltransferase
MEHLDRSHVVRFGFAILGVALLLRLWLVVTIGADHGPVDDEWAYRWAPRSALLFQRWSPNTLECRAPGYPLLLRSLALLGIPATGMLLVQAALGTATIGLAMVFARRCMGAAAATVTALALAFNPTLLTYTVLFMSETLFLFLLLAFLVLLLWPDSRRTTTVAAGVFLGLSLLTRSTLLPFAGMLAIWLLAGGHWPHREARARVFLLCAAAGLTILPWTIRNAIVYRELIPIDCYTMNSLWEGNNPLGWNVDIMNQYWNQSASPTEREQFALGETIRFLRGQPWTYPIEKLGQIAQKLATEQDKLTATYYAKDRFGPLSPSTTTTILQVERYYYLFLTALGIVGFAATGRSRERTVVALLWTSLLASHWITFVFPRHRIPFLPFLAIFAAGALTAPAAVRAMSPLRAAVMLITLAGFGVGVWFS